VLDTRRLSSLDAVSVTAPPQRYLGSPDRRTRETAENKFIFFSSYFFNVVFVQPICCRQVCTEHGAFFRKKTLRKGRVVA